MTQPTQQHNDNNDSLLKVSREDSKSFATFYAALYPLVRSFLTKRDTSIDHHSLEDIIQETFLRTWKARLHLEKNVSKAYVLGMAKNVLREHQRRHRRRPYMVFTGDLSDHHKKTTNRSLADRQETNKQSIAKAIKEALGKLPAAQQQAYRLIHVKRFSVAKAAKLANCNPNQFAVRLHYARKQLELLLRKRLVLPPTVNITHALAKCYPATRRCQEQRSSSEPEPIF